MCIVIKFDIFVIYDKKLSHDLSRHKILGFMMFLALPILKPFYQILNNYFCAIDIFSNQMNMNTFNFTEYQLILASGFFNFCVWLRGK